MSAHHLATFDNLSLHEVGRQASRSPHPDAASTQKRKRRASSSSSFSSSSGAPASKRPTLSQQTSTTPSNTPSQQPLAPPSTVGQKRKRDAAAENSDDNTPANKRPAPLLPYMQAALDADLQTEHPSPQPMPGSNQSYSGYRPPAGGMYEGFLAHLTNLARARQVGGGGDENGFRHT
ncbi:uncharacterized protein BKCO1_37000118 [Diplodia corticola]|uniref:Uncharacterized protein n=1 Tax=Diplodia corticola TaxID=236234 RepID=A0A1J9RXH4_9PEZI|nr:uncharacterized protein BKCO1_37000118 [Diplodia corticola]OJD32532.1 hypothetical protein BKCO1_37000118 [Diplodia corticola]